MNHELMCVNVETDVRLYSGYSWLQAKRPLQGNGGRRSTHWDPLGGHTDDGDTDTQGTADRTTDGGSGLDGSGHRIDMTASFVVILLFLVADVVDDLLYCVIVEQKENGKKKRKCF